MKTGNSIQVEAIKVSAMSGTQAAPCISDAVLLAAEQRKDVILVHNITTYKVDYQAMLKSVKTIPTKEISVE